MSIFIIGMHPFKKKKKVEVQIKNKLMASFQTYPESEYYKFWRELQVHPHQAL